MPVNHFDRLGLPIRFETDPAELERAYLALGRELHPDYHQQGATAEQYASMELTSRLNDAYATLRHPFRRADYLLGLLGGPSAAEAKEMAPAFLEEMLELRMEIEELRRDPSHQSPGRQRMLAQLNSRSEKLTADLAAVFARLEKVPVDDPARKPLLKQTRQILNAARYIQGLQRDLEAD